jgi:hypothetical protein
LFGESSQSTFRLSYGLSLPPPGNTGAPTVAEALVGYPYDTPFNFDEFFFCGGGVGGSVMRISPMVSCGRS